MNRELAKAILKDLMKEYKEKAKSDENIEYIIEALDFAIADMDSLQNIMYELNSVSRD